MPAEIGRVVALGASNLTRGLQTVVASARGAWGPEVEIVAALGHGRSYGADSHFVVRTLPGILQSGLWRKLETAAPVPTRALVTDVGNDILYGYPVEQVLEWVDEALGRLRLHTDDIVVTDLPLGERATPVATQVLRIQVGSGAVLPALSRRSPRAGRAGQRGSGHTRGEPRRAAVPPRAVLVRRRSDPYQARALADRVVRDPGRGAGARAVGGRIGPAVPDAARAPVALRRGAGDPASRNRSARRRARVAVLAGVRPSLRRPLTSRVSAPASSTSCIS